MYMFINLELITLNINYFYVDLSIKTSIDYMLIVTNLIFSTMYSLFYQREITYDHWVKVKKGKKCAIISFR